MAGETEKTGVAARGRRPSRSTLAVVVVILAAVGLCYHGALGNDFVYDDHDLVNGNDYLKGWMAGAPDPQGRPVPYVWRMLTADFASLAQRFGREVADPPISYYRPVIAVSYMVDTLFWADIPRWEGPPPGTEKTLEWSSIRPFGYHLTNILFHALNSFLVFLLARSLFRRHAAALVAALVFAVHPMHTESVSWIAGRTDVIATTFFLAAFWGYVRFRRTGSRWALITAAGLFAVGMFAKEMVAVLPLVLAAWEVWRLGPPREGVARLGRAALPRAFGPVAIFAALILPYFLVKAGIAPPVSGNPETRPDQWSGVAFGTILITLPTAINWYVLKLLAPIHFNIYPMLPFAKAEAVGAWLPWLVLHVALGGGAIWVLLRGRRFRWAAWLIVAGYLTFAPLSCLVPGLRLARFTVDIDFPVSERFLYIPSVFLALGFGLAVRQLGFFATRRGRLALGTALAAVTLGAAAVCADRNRDWAWNLALFRSAVEASPESIRMRLNYGAALTADVWAVREGRRNYHRGVWLGASRGRKRSRPELHESLGNSYFLSGEYARSVRHLRTAWYRMGRLPEHGNRFAVTLSVYATITGNVAWMEEAVRVFEVVLARSPRHPMARDSARFCATTLGVWREFHARGPVNDEVVRRYALSFLMPARSLSAEDDPTRRLQALEILDAGLARLPGAEALARFPRSARLRAEMVERAAALVRDLDTHYRGLETRFPGRVALTFLRAEVNRTAGLRLGDAPARNLAARLYAAVLAGEPDHGEAAIGLLTLAAAGDGDHRAAAREAARRTAMILLDRDRVWEGRPLPTRPRKAVEIAGRLAALDPAREGPFLRRIVRRALADLERRVSTPQGARDIEALAALAGMEIRAAEVLGEPARLARAAAHLREAHRIAPRAVPVLIRLIAVLGRLGRHGEAREMQRRLEALHRPRR